MPGITGILTHPDSRDASVILREMAGVMMHEEHYSMHRCELPRLGIHAASVNLRSSPSDCMPIWTENRDKALLLSGECFVDRDVIQALITRGHTCALEGPQWVIHKYEEEGERLFDSLNGWYCGLILDLTSDEAHLFCDRYGQRRLYYHEDAQGLYFSSEAKSLLRVMPELRCLDTQALCQYVNYECVLGGRTLFKGIQTIPPGSVWTAGRGRVRRRLVYDVRKLEQQSMLDVRSFETQFDDAFTRVLPRYLTEARPLLSLSGGLDTRMILAYARSLGMATPCFTHGSMYNEMLDVRIARKVAMRAGLEHTIAPVGEEFLRDFSTWATKTVFISDGLADACQAHLLYCNSIARSLGATKITGKFGSQVLKGISAFARPGGYNADSGLMGEVLSHELKAAQQEFGSAGVGHPLSVLLFREIPWWWSGITALEVSQLDVCSPYLDNEIVSLLYRRPGPSAEAAGLQVQLIRKRDPSLFSIMSDKGFGGGESPLATFPRRAYYSLLTLGGKVYERDKLPLSLHHVVAAVDAWVLSPLRIDRLLLGRADYRHYRTWFRDRLSEFLRNVLLDAQTLSRPYWSRRYIENMVFAHTEGRANRLNEIRKVLTVELVERCLLRHV